MDLISRDIFRRFISNSFDCHLLDLAKLIVHVKSIIEGPDFMVVFLRVSYWTVFNKYFKPATYLMDPISCEFSPRYSRKYLEAKYWIPGPYLVDLILCDLRKILELLNCV